MHLSPWGLPFRHFSVPITDIPYNEINLHSVLLYWRATHLWKSCLIASSLEYINELSNSSFLNILFLRGCGCLVVYLVNICSHGSDSASLDICCLCTGLWTVATSPCAVTQSGISCAVCVAGCLNGFELVSIQIFTCFQFIYRIGIRFNLITNLCLNDC